MAGAKSRTSPSKVPRMPLGARPAAKPAEGRTAVAEARSVVKSAPSQARTSDAHAEVKPGSLQEFLNYQRDVLERTVLFWDTLRERADNMLEHERTGLPPLLDFKFET